MDTKEGKPKTISFQSCLDEKQKQGSIAKRDKNTSVTPESKARFIEKQKQYTL